MLPVDIDVGGAVLVNEGDFGALMLIQPLDGWLRWLGDWLRKGFGEGGRRSHSG